MSRLSIKYGFTLLEIIVVMVILSILCSIAVIYIFTNINRSHSAEALTALSNYKNQLVACCSVHPEYADISQCNGGSLAFPSTENFNYYVNSGSCDPNDTIVINAQYFRVVPFDPSPPTITVAGNLNAGFSCWGSKVLQGVC